MSAEALHLVFVSGLSGSGKSTAMGALEDLGFYGVDNLPPQLVPQFLDLCAKASPPIRKVVLSIDARESPFLAEFPRLVSDLRSAGAQVEVLFLECASEVLINRYRETRRVHPLAPEGTVQEGIESERELLMEVARLADSVIDTSRLNIHQLRDAIVHLVFDGERATVVNLISFGFRYGLPQGLEMLFDVRVLPNPYFEPALRDRSGHDEEVAAYVLKEEALLDRLGSLLSFLLPLYDREGKAYLTMGIGCTGGRHRSVAIVNALAESLRAAGREVNVNHRDVEGKG